MPRSAADQHAHLARTRAACDPHARRVGDTFEVAAVGGYIAVDQFVFEIQRIIQNVGHRSLSSKKGCKERQENRKRF